MKALVIEDLNGDLPVAFGTEHVRKNFGVVIRTKPNQLDADIALKLRVANGTHTAAAHVMALTGMVLTDILSSQEDSRAKLIVQYLDSFFYHQIVKGVDSTAEFAATPEDAKSVYDDWRRRLIHAHFGLSTFFITQNGAAKGGIRIGPTVKDLIISSGNNNNTVPVTCSTAFALAAILRFLTPTAAADESTTMASPTENENENGIYRGWLDNDGANSKQSGDDGEVSSSETTVT